MLWLKIIKLFALYLKALLYRPEIKTVATTYANDLAGCKSGKKHKFTLLDIFRHSHSTLLNEKGMLFIPDTPSHSQCVLLLVCDYNTHP